MEIRPIRNDEEHAAALKAIEALWGAPAGSSEGDKLEVLTTLVDAYEKTRWPIEPLDPVETIKQHMQATDRDQADLGNVIGSRSRASEIMTRKRPLTMGMVRRIVEEWHLPADLLITPYRLRGKRAAKGPGRKVRAA